MHQLRMLSSIRQLGSSALESGTDMPGCVGGGMALPTFKALDHFVLTGTHLLPRRKALLFWTHNRLRRPAAAARTVGCGLLRRSGVGSKRQGHLP